MPRQTKTTDTKNVVAQDTQASPVATAAATPAPTPVVQEPARKTRGKNVAATPVEVAAPAPAPVAVADPTPVAVDEVTVDAVQDSGAENEAKTRVAPTRESVMTDFAELLSLVEGEIDRLRESSDKSHSAKFLRQVMRRLRSLQSNTARVLKHKAPSGRRNNNSGFLKPVNISSDMAKFTGFDPKVQHSRVDVTKFLCKYIKDKNLQNPVNKREINADPALSKLLNYDPKTSVPLTYPSMQKLLKNHFAKPQ